MKTVTELKAIAKEMKIVGRDKMKREQLEAAILDHQSRFGPIDEDGVGILETIESEAVVEDAAAVVKEVKRRKASSRERDEVGKVVRKGRNLSGNQPFRGKPYYYDLDAAEEIGEAAYNAAPMQVRLILKYMREEGITTIDDAMRGGEIAGGAINGGYLQSKIEPAALFAYYRRLMERLGVRLAYEEA